MDNTKELERLIKEGHTLDELIDIFGDKQEIRDMYVNSCLMNKDFEKVRMALIEQKQREIVRKCRDMVRNSPDKNYYPTVADTLLGYIYEEDGHYRKYYLESSPENIAKFIYSSDKEKFITTSNDYALMNTMCGTYLDLSCAHAKYTTEVVDHLTKYQKGMEYQTFESR